MIGHSHGAATAKSGLALELVATMWVEDDDKWSMAVIRDTGSKEKDARMYNAGKLIDGTTVSVARVVGAVLFGAAATRFRSARRKRPGSETLQRRTEYVASSRDCR